MPVKTVTSPSSTPQVTFHLTDRRSKMITANNNNNNNNKIKIILKTGN